jgi:hypothetical protein
MPTEKQRLVFPDTRLAHRCQGLKLHELKTSINRVMNYTLRKSEHENIKLRISTESRTNISMKQNKTKHELANSTKKHA